MTHAGTDLPTPPQPAAETPAEKSGAKKWLAIGGSVLVVGVGAAFTLTGGFGIGAPKVGDCIQELPDYQMEVVDCGSSDADYKIVGIEGEKLTEDEFMADAESCFEFADAATVEAAFWESAGFVSDKGTVYCAGPV